MFCRVRLSQVGAQSLKSARFNIDKLNIHFRLRKFFYILNATKLKNMIRKLKEAITSKALHVVPTNIMHQTKY